VKTSPRRVVVQKGSEVRRALIQINEDNQKAIQNVGPEDCILPLESMSIQAEGDTSLAAGKEKQVYKKDIWVPKVKCKGGPISPSLPVVLIRINQKKGGGGT